jgi:hypothetical protein
LKKWKPADDASRLGRDLGDAAAHGACANDADDRKGDLLHDGIMVLVGNGWTKSGARDLLKPMQSRIFAPLYSQRRQNPADWRAPLSLNA